MFSPATPWVPYIGVGSRTHWLGKRKTKIVACPVLYRVSSEMTERRSSHRTQWAAQHAVASELHKRDYQVALALGNTPMFDLMVTSPIGNSFQVDVKGLYKPNYWQVRSRKPQTGLFYVFAYVPDEEQNRFFVMTQQTVNKLIDDHRNEYPPKENYREGIPWKRAEAHEDQWKVLPD